MQYTLVYYTHSSKKVTQAQFEVDENFFLAAMKFPATPTGGSAYNSFFYQLAEEMVTGGAKKFAWVDKVDVIGGFGADKREIAELMTTVAYNQAQLDEEEIDAMREVLASNGLLTKTAQPDANAQTDDASKSTLSDELKNQFRSLGGITPRQ